LIPVLDEIEHIEATAARMRMQRLDGHVEFLFVDGGSSDGTRAVLDELAAVDGRVRALDNPAGHIPAALNIGLRHSRGRYVARMDAHTYYPRDYLRRGVERIGRGDVAWVSGPALPWGTDRWSRLVELALTTWLGVGGASFRRPAPEEFDSDTGFTGIWRRETLLHHAGWDEASLVNEDAELAARMRETGERIVCVPQMAARYVPRNSVPALARQYWRYGQYRARTSSLHPESLRRSNLLPPAVALVFAAAVLAPPRVSRPARAGVATYLLAISGASAAAARRASIADALRLPLVFIAMHLPWGFGFLLGSLRFGLPLEAVGRALGYGRDRTAGAR
jgi:glycosyltransferase involved in cell wall biosynthesis